ncbi:reverse transcriptase-like protein [Citrus sinensis]|uniref:Reverse transcriptase-like protein n=1 Tax=Citrus sinensis TaxID=2711 RepID=A0ACB8N1E1_CITSI|nr:reverse transcriptase-like protein [Citrus sinensis]
MWRAARNLLPTAQNLWKKKILSSPWCQRCRRTRESTYHALVSCKVSQKVWKGGDMFGFLQEMAGKRSKSDMELIVATCWAIWSERNLFIFENKKEDSQLSAAKADAVVYSYKKIQLPQLQTSIEKKSNATSNWQSPPPGCFKVNVDASVVVEQRRVGLGAVIRDARGKVIAAATKPSCFQQEVAYAEAEAARFGVAIAEKVGCWPLIIETDSQEVVDLVLNKKSTRTELYLVISDL